MKLCLQSLAVIVGFMCSLSKLEAADVFNHITAVGELSLEDVRNMRSVNHEWRNWVEQSLRANSRNNDGRFRRARARWMRIHQADDFSLLRGGQLVSNNRHLIYDNDSLQNLSLKRECFEFYQKWAAERCVEAVYMLGHFYVRGIGTDRSTREGLRLLALASDLGMSEATFDLAHMLLHKRIDLDDYVTGEIVGTIVLDIAPKDRTKFRIKNLLAMSIEQGHAPGPVYYQLGLLYLYEGTEKGKDKATRWMERSAHEGYQLARAFLAL